MGKLVEDIPTLTNIQTSASTLTQSSNILDEIKKHIEALVYKIDNYSRNGSGWVVENVYSINIMITKLRY